VELTQTSIRTWADETGIPSLIMAEQDLRLLYALQAIYSDPYLSSRLGLKGGTALNKLYFPELGRLSLDLDFNAVGTKEAVFTDRWPVVDRITAHLTGQDNNYVIKTNYSYEQTTIRASYLPTLGTRPQSIKLEISFVERFPILAPAIKSLEIPALGEPLSIQSYALDERDTIFLLLARHLLGQPIPGSRRDDVQAIEFPLRYLFEGYAITPEARNVTVDDIRLHRRA